MGKNLTTATRGLVHGIVTAGEVGIALVVRGARAVIGPLILHCHRTLM